MTHKDILHFWRNIEIFDLDTKKMLPLDSLLYNSHKIPNIKVLFTFCRGTF